MKDIVNRNSNNSNNNGNNNINKQTTDEEKAGFSLYMQITILKI